MSGQDTIREVLQRIERMTASKGHDYATDEDFWSNFRGTAKHFAIPMYEAADFNEIQKLERLRALRSRSDSEMPATPLHEAVSDTYLDKAVYAVLAYAMYLDAQATMAAEYIRGADENPQGKRGIQAGGYN